MKTSITTILVCIVSFAIGQTAQEVDLLLQFRSGLGSVIVDDEDSYERYLLDQSNGISRLRVAAIENDVNSLKSILNSEVMKYSTSEEALVIKNQAYIEFLFHSSERLDSIFSYRNDIKDPDLRQTHLKQCVIYALYGSGNWWEALQFLTEIEDEDWVHRINSWISLEFKFDVAGFLTQYGCLDSEIKNQDLFFLYQCFFLIGHEMKISNFENKIEWAESNFLAGELNQWLDKCLFWLIVLDQHEMIQSLKTKNQLVDSYKEISLILFAQKSSSDGIEQSIGSLSENNKILAQDILDEKEYWMQLRSQLRSSGN